MNVAHVFDQSNARLEQLESDWLKGKIPDVASYLRQSADEAPQTWRDLVELDLEYRWRRFQHSTSESALDPFGFPQYPKLEHYADLVDEPLRSQLLSPELLAEEYRVRTFWGDRPPKQQYVERLPQDSDQVESALEVIDLELEVEGMTAFLEDAHSAETTQLFDQRSAELDETLPGTETPARLGKYLLKELLGRGGFGEVWKAYDPDLKRYVALKFPCLRQDDSQELFENFRREAEKMAALESVPGVVQVFEAGDQDGLPYIVSSLIEGEDLSVRQKHAPLSFEESARIVADVAETLHRAHLKDLFHRDVKLANILIDENGDVYLSDFGLCVSEQEQLHEGHSATGTYAYMAPEQIHGNSHRVDGRADIYALGVVLYRLLSGRLPFIGNTSVEYMEQTLKKSPRPLRSIDDNIPEELERICTKCLQKRVEDRYSTASDLARDLRNWLNSPAASTIAEPAFAASQIAVPPQQTFSRRHPVLLALAVLLIALGGLLAWNRDLAKSVLLAGLWTSPEESTAIPPVELDENVIFLRDSAPQALQTPDIQNEWIPVEGLNAVEVKKNSGFCMKSIGELEPGDFYTIKVDLREIPVDSSAGLFFGQSQPLVKSSDSYWQSILVQRTADGFELFAMFTVYTSDVRHTSRRYSRRLEIGERAAREKIELRIFISENGVQGISVNGESFDDLADGFRTGFPKLMVSTEERSADFEYATPADFSGLGRFGLICHWNSAIFADPVINGQPYKLKLEKAE